MNGVAPMMYRLNERIGKTSHPLAQRQYHELDLSSRIATASPVALVSMLYDELATSLTVIRSALASGRLETVNVQSDKAQSILLSLLASLDLEQGGDLAHMLADVYRGMLSTLAKFTRTRELRLLDEMIAGLDNIKASWDVIAANL